ncbi:MAG: hypothetical protein ACJ789_04235 [Thermomicrobiales bacterium]
MGLEFAHYALQEYAAHNCWVLIPESSAAPDGRGVIGRTVAPLACFF